jgi:Fur family transcriptional regulator, zinc uptake regulator
MDQLLQGDRQSGEKRKKLSSKEELVAKVLREEPRPWKAYELIAHLRNRGFSSPPIVYRALERLVRCGLAHRLESLHAFVTCADDCSRGSGVALFAICETCGEATEFQQPQIIGALTSWAEENKFSVRHVTLEIKGQCARCISERPATSQPSGL